MSGETKPLPDRARVLCDTLEHLKREMTVQWKEAAAIAGELVAYVRSLLPIAVADDDPAAQTQWLVVRLTGTLDGVFLLGRAGLHEDASALVRVMVDHLLAFSWLLADDRPPTRINAWKNNDLRLMNAQKAEAAALGVDLAAAPDLVESSDVWVSAAHAAKESDEFWQRRLEPFFTKGTVNSFAGLYAAVFRATSAYVHPSALRGARGFFLVPTGGDGKNVLISPSYASLPDTYCDAVVIALLAVWILVARFRHEDVPKILPLFDRVVAIRRAMDEDGKD